MSNNLDQPFVELDGQRLESEVEFRQYKTGPGQPPQLPPDGEFELILKGDNALAEAKRWSAESQRKVSEKIGVTLRVRNAPVSPENPEYQFRWQCELTVSSGDFTNLASRGVVLAGPIRGQVAQNDGSNTTHIPASEFLERVANAVG